MRLFSALIISITLAGVGPLRAAPPAAPVAAAVHQASRREVLAFLRREGILDDTQRVDSATRLTRGGDWLITLRLPSGRRVFFTVDTTARNWSYICQH